MNMKKNIIIRLSDVSKTYQMGSEKVHALKDVSLEISSGEFVAIMGSSGSGKSTLLHTLGLLDRPDSGTYMLGNKDVTKLSDEEMAMVRNRLMGFVFQQFHLLPRMTALENAEMPLIYAGKRRMKEKAREKLQEVGLADRLQHRPSELSGGQQQRVAIARSLVNEPLIILADEPTGNLDTKSKDEIMSLLKELNEKGKTIIIVTHEKEIAEHTRRIIQMRDGEIISDKATENGRQRPEEEKDPVYDVLHGSAALGGTAKFMDYFRQAVYAMLSHKMRSFLSILGILIGVAAVIAMLALGQGAEQAISTQLSSMGSNLLVIRPGSQRLHGVSMEAGAVTRFTFQDVAAIEKLKDLVKRVSPSVTGRGQLVYGNKNWNTQIEGAGADYAEMRAAVPPVGRFLTEDEVREREKVAVIGTTVARELFGSANPVGETIKMNRINFRVIGILPAKGADHFRDQDDIVIIPVTTAMYRVLGKEYIDTIYAEIMEMGMMEDAQDAISKIIIKQHHLGKGGEDSFQIRNMAEIQEAIKTTTQTMATLLGSIAAVSLLVGGIGIMNIMLVSVTERTREIGLRKAIGARRRDVMIQFLIEAVMLSAIGGATGILAGTGISMLLAHFAGWTLIVSLFSIVLSTVFSIVVGVIFGLWPARQASRLNPIEALRYE
jgi:macrolide transport system ATP-binding/permease protein